MTENWRIAIDQINYTIGDLEDNWAKIIWCAGRVKDPDIN